MTPEDRRSESEKLHSHLDASDAANRDMREAMDRAKVLKAADKINPPDGVVQDFNDATRDWQAASQRYDEAQEGIDFIRQAQADRKAAGEG